MSLVTSEVRDLVGCSHGSALAFAGLFRCPHCGAVKTPAGVWAAPHLVAAVARRYAEECAAPAAPDDPPGADHV
jgi:hypothetical protein